MVAAVRASEAMGEESRPRVREVIDLRHLLPEVSQKIRLSLKHLLLAAANLFLGARGLEATCHLLRAAIPHHG
jgi:hypothetical protein